MGNFFQLFARYGGVIVRYAQYLQYLPLLAKLASLVRNAQKEFSGAGTNEQKAQWVAAQFRDVIGELVSTGLVSKERADKLLVNIESVVTAIVQWYNFTLGDVPLPDPEPAPVEPPTPAAATFPYDTVLQFHPLTMNEAGLLKPTDRIYRRRGTERGWMVPGNSMIVATALWQLDDTQPPQ